MASRMQLSDLLTLREDADFEVKAAQGRNGDGEVPNSVWETYSAMANTDGGVILLGVGEETDRSLTVLGLRNPERVRKALWDNLNDRKTVSSNILVNSDVEVVDVEDKQILRIRVPRATRQQRPVYVGSNPLTGSYRRNFEGDYHCSEAAVRRMLGDALEETRDAKLLPNFGLDDLNPDSLAAYRNELRSTRPGHPWVVVDDHELLRYLGGWTQDRETGQQGLTLAGLLMFGKFRPIHDAVPDYIVDYQERSALPTPRQRWIDRVTTDGTWSGNLFDFFRLVYPKLTAGLKVPFRLEQGFKRIDESFVHEALREALLNTLIHADYSGSVGIMVLRTPERFSFRNPGGLRLPVNVILAGGLSDCRNRNLQKKFQLIGAGEQAGSGFPKILSAWREQHWRAPVLLEQTQPEQCVLHMPMISLFPPETLEELDRRFGSAFRNMEETARLALATALIEGRVTNERLRQITDAHPRDLTTMLRLQVDHGYLVPSGAGRGTFYQLPGSAPATGYLLPLEEALSAALASEQMAASSEQMEPNSEQMAASSEHRARAEAAAAAVRNTRKAYRRETIEEAIVELCRNTYITLKELATLLGRSPNTLRVHYLNSMVRRGLLELRHPDKLNHPEQGYRARGAE